jgi:hypothetical protein
MLVISPRLAQVPVSRKNWITEPVQKALQIVEMLVWAVSCDCSQPLAGRWPRPISARRLTS